MPYRRILEALLARVAGARSALLLDAQGEVVVGAGQLDERERLIGAYQGIVLSHARRAAERCGSGSVAFLVARYATGAVVLRPLKDEYYLVLCLGPKANVALAVLRSEETEARMNAAL